MKTGNRDRKKGKERVAQGALLGQQVDLFAEARLDRAHHLGSLLLSGPVSRHLGFDGSQILDHRNRPGNHQSDQSIDSLNT